MLLSFNCALLHWCEENYTVPSLIKCLICEWLYGQINQKKLKKYEKEYLVLREQQAQQEDPVERYEVGVDKWRAGTCYPCSTAFVTTFAKNTSIKISPQFPKFPLCQFISEQEVLRMHTQVYLVFCFLLKSWCVLSAVYFYVSWVNINASAWCGCCRTSHQRPIMNWAIRSC